MLILTRRPGEQIYIDGDSIKVYVMSVDGNAVRIGIDAPPDVSIHRKEIHERIEKEKEHDQQQ